ncbi:MAG: TonB-dependent receptor plug domain-containing protein [Pseudomonadota bacterium]
MNRSKIALSAAMLVAATNVGAQSNATSDTDNTEVLPLEEVIVRSTRRELGLESIPRSVLVFETPDFENLIDQTTSVQEILGKLVPGFSPPVTEGSAGSLTLRGRDPLYLIDGVR